MSSFHIFARFTHLPGLGFADGSPQHFSVPKGIWRKRKIKTPQITSANKHNDAHVRETSAKEVKDGNTEVLKMDSLAVAPVGIL